MAKKKLHSLVFAEHFTQNPKIKGTDIEKMFSWGRRDCLIKDRRGGNFFEKRNVEAPEGWSQLAVDIAASKYFRKKTGSFKGEHSVKQMVQRVVAAIVKAGLAQGGIF